MGADRATRLGRYAVLAWIHLVLNVALLIGGDPGRAGAVVLLLAAAGLFFAWGAFLGDLALNDHPCRAERRRWQIALWVLPWIAMPLYRRRYASPAQATRD